MKNVDYFDLTLVQQLAVSEALKVLEYSYNPYSHFYVGATLISQSGELVSGTNVENAAYGSTICAERAAILSANARGIRKFSGIAIIARGENFDTTEVTGPCGSCRQMLYEVSQISNCNLEVILSTTDKSRIVLTTIRELLPLAFGPLDIGVDIAKYKN